MFLNASGSLLLRARLIRTAFRIKQTKAYSCKNLGAYFFTSMEINREKMMYAERMV